MPRTDAAPWPEGRSATGAAFREAGVRVPGVPPVGPLLAKPTETVKNWL
ncbi:hypothetical protein ACH4TE_03695 [Streptomyces sioyaensis]